MCQPDPNLKPEEQKPIFGRKRPRNGPTPPSSPTPKTRPWADKGDLPDNLKRYKELINSKNISRKECILLPFNALKKGLTNGK